MSIPAAWNACDFAFDGSAYTYPTSADFSWAPAVTSVTGDGAFTLASTPAASASHGVAGTGASTLVSTAAGDATYTSIAVSGDGAATLDTTADAAAEHGVAGAGAAVLDLSEGAAAAHGIAGYESATVGFVVSSVAEHGIAGAAATTITFAPDAQAIHERYELRGEVRDSGVLVNRRVRAYLRDTGALVGETDTVAGKFNVHTGFTAVEHYIVPVNLDAAATDWTPPVANRVVSVLAQDV